MLRKRITESLTARIFLITAGVLLAAGAVTFSFIAWASPSTYTAVVNDDLTAQVDALVGKLADTTPADCGELLDDFVLTSGQFFVEKERFGWECKDENVTLPSQSRKAPSVITARTSGKAIR